MKFVRGQIIDGKGVVFSRLTSPLRERQCTHDSPFVTLRPRPGRPKIFTDEKSMKLVADILQEDRRVTCGETSQATAISAISVFRILIYDLQKRKICA